ncbi:MAG: PA14 domain-containing protein, partial [Bacteroidota bacterium]|nr:PA14 domain-containing protein [Bacteroidota bacterium]
ITTPFGQIIPANKPYTFSFKKFFQPINWIVNWFAFDSLSNPIKTGKLFADNIRVRPFKTEHINKLDYSWWGGMKENEIQHEQFITTAEGEATFIKGVYELGVTWDDAVRIYMDGKLIIDEWNPSKYKFDESPHKKIRLNLGGIHRFRVEHVELGGFATLSLKLNPVQ